MLEALQRYDPTTARSILAASTTAMDSYPIQNPTERPFGREIQEVLEEVRRSLNVSEADMTGRARGRVSDALFEAFKQLTFRDRSLESVVESLGRRGALPTSAYSVALADDITSRFLETAKFVRRAVPSAEIVEHTHFQSQQHFEKAVIENLDPDVRPLPVEERNGTTLLLKHLARRKAGEQWAFFHASRRGAHLVINAAMRVFPEVISLPAAPNPRDVLKALVDRYGVTFERPGLISPTKLVEDTVVPADHDKTHPLKFHEGDKVAYVETGEEQTVLRGAEGVVAHDRRIMFAYAIDMPRYHADRRRLG